VGDREKAGARGREGGSKRETARESKGEIQGDRGTSPEMYSS